MRLVAHTALFVAVAPGALTVAVPSLVAWLTGARVAGGVTLPLATVVLATGLAIFVWCVSDFITAGRGTPAPYEAPRELVVRGLYRIVRNPMYVGVLTVIVGEALLLRSLPLLAYVAAVFAAFHARVLWYEEPTLARQFGGTWDDYRRSVPRWLPRIARAPRD